MGVILVLLLPIAFLVGSAIFIWRYLYHPKGPQRRAAFILMDDPDEAMVCFPTVLLSCVHVTGLLSEMPPGLHSGQGEAVILVYHWYTLRCMT